MRTMMISFLLESYHSHLFWLEKELVHTYKLFRCNDDCTWPNNDDDNDDDDGDNGDDGDDGDDGGVCDEMTDS